MAPEGRDTADTLSRNLLDWGSSVLTVNSPSKKRPQTLSPDPGFPGSAQPGAEHRHRYKDGQISVIVTILPSWLLVIIRSSQLCNIFTMSTRTRYLISPSHTYMNTHTTAHTL